MKIDQLRQELKDIQALTAEYDSDMLEEAKKQGLDFEKEITNALMKELGGK